MDDVSLSRRKAVKVGFCSGVIGFSSIQQANAAGRYNHPRDPNKAELDHNFQGWAIVPSGEEGDFKFKTIKPGIYPVGGGWKRPPHIHFKVSYQGFQTLTTQMYFPGEELNKAKESFLTNRQGGRSRDGRLAGELLQNLRTGRTMDFQKASDEKISSLSKEQVDAVLKKVIDPERLLIVTAGDFSKVQDVDEK